MLVAAGSGERLSYALVALEPGFSQRFADESGAFFFAAAVPGRYRLLARLVGFAPLDTALDVTDATPALRLEMRRLPVTLPAINVAVLSSCTVPGPPEPGRDPTLHRVFAQLAENASRYLVLADSFPFRSRIERKFTTLMRGRGDTESPVTETDTLLERSDERWRYAPGTLVDRVHERGRRVTRINLPTLPDLADSVFQANHCFVLMGHEELDGESLVRLEFRVAESVRSPDVNGRAWLHPASYQLRRMDVSLTHPERAGEGIETVEVEVGFREVVPNVIVASRVVSHVRPRTRSRLPTLEVQRLLQVEFLRGLAN